MNARFSYRKSKQDIVIIVQHTNKRKQKKIADCLPDEWDENNRMVNERHPEFEDLYPDMMKMKLKVRKLKREGVLDPSSVIDELFGSDDDNPDLLIFWNDYINDLKAKKEAAQKENDIVERNRIAGNISYYTSILSTVKRHVDSIYYKSFNPITAQRLENDLLQNAQVSRGTVVKYMKATRTMYRNMVRYYRLPHLDPFQYNNVKEVKRSYEQKKRRLIDDDLKKLEQLDLSGTFKTARDMFMVLFDCGGCDLKDIYYLTHEQVIDGRIMTQRAKVAGSSVDVMISDRMAAFMKVHQGDDIFVFTWRKDEKGYRTWSGNMRRQLKLVGLRNSIKTVSGGELGWKVARHTFASRAKEMGIDGDLLRELMGHRRDDVDNYYKEAFPEKVRNEAQLKIIEL